MHAAGQVARALAWKIRDAVTGQELPERLIGKNGLPLAVEHQRESQASVQFHGKFSSPA